MFIIIKYIFKSMAEKKSRTVLIVLAVMLASALFFASTSLSSSMVGLYTKQAKQESGNAEIMIYAKQEADTNLISMLPAQMLNSFFEYIIPVVYTSAKYAVDYKRSEPIQIMGIEWEDYEKMNEVCFFEKLGNTSFKDNMLIVTKKTAEQYGWNTGDIVELTIADIKHKIKIYGVSDNIGYFGGERTSPYGIMPFSTLSKYFELNNKPTTIYLKTNVPAQLEQLIQDLRQNYPKCEVREPILQEDLEEQMSWIIEPLFLMSIIVSLMSIFIIYSSFKVIMLEKLPVLGTFRSVGASCRRLRQVLTLESIVYGVIGSSLGLLLGIGLLYAMTLVTATSEIDSHIKVTIQIIPVRLLMAFILGMVICITSSMMPILKTSKMQVKEIILDIPTNTKKIKNRKRGVGVILIFIGLILPQYTPKSIGMVVTTLSVIACIMGAVMLIPMLVKYLLPILSPICKLCFGNVGQLAIKNIKHNKSIMNSITLISIAVGIILMINNIGSNIKTEVFQFYQNKFNYDIVLWLDGMDKKDISTLSHQEGVKEALGICSAGYYTKYDLSVKEWEQASINLVYGVSDLRFDEYIKVDYRDTKDVGILFNKLNDGRYVLLSSVLKKRYGIAIGDDLTFNMSQGERKYEVIGFYDSIMSMGNTALMGERYLRQDMGIKGYDDIYIKTNQDPQQVLDRLKKTYSNRNVFGRTKAEQSRQDEESNQTIMSLLYGFSVLAVIIGIIGVINNLIISFIERKRGLAILRSVGMSQKQIVNMLLIEELCCGALGSFIGILIGRLVLWNIPILLELMQMPVKITFLSSRIWIYFGVPIVITLLVSSLLTRRSSKIEIIQAIKYE